MLRNDSPAIHLTVVDRCRALCCALALSAALAPTVAAQYARTDHFDGAVATLQRCASPSPTGEHHALIVSLRALSDPTLRPLFEALTRSNNWSSRVDGILGLAELSKDRDVDLALINRLSASEDRSTAIRNAIGLRLIRPDTIRELLETADLPTLDRVILSGDLHRQGETFDSVGLREAASDPSDEIAGLSAALMLQRGTSAPWDAFTVRLATRTVEVRNMVVQELARAALLYSIKAIISPLLTLSDDASYTTPTRMMIIGTALALEPERGYSAWKKLVESDRSQPTLVRAGLQLIAQERTIAAGMGASLRNGDALVEALATAVDANGSSDPALLAQALMGVIDVANRSSGEWAVRRASALPPALSAEVWRHLLVRFLAAPANAPALSASVLDCATRLALVDPAAIGALIAAASQEIQLQEILILSLCNAATPQSAQVAQAVRGSLTRRGDALAILAIARGLETLDSDSLKALGVVAAGGGDLDPTMLVQAAWLFARHSGRADQALAQIQPQ